MSDTIQFSQTVSAGGSTLMLRRRVGNYRQTLGDAELANLLCVTERRLLEIARRVGRPPAGLTDEDVLQSAWAGQLGRMLSPEGPEIRDTRHFFCLAAHAISQALTDLRRTEGRHRSRLRTAAEAGVIANDLQPAGRSLDPEAALALDVKDAFEAVPEKDRVVFSMRKCSGYSRSETARLLDMTESEVRTCVQRCQEMLTRRLAAYGPEA